MLLHIPKSNFYNTQHLYACIFSLTENKEDILQIYSQTEFCLLLYFSYLECNVAKIKHLRVRGKRVFSFLQDYYYKNCVGAWHLESVIRTLSFILVRFWMYMSNVMFTDYRILYQNRTCIHDIITWIVFNFIQFNFNKKSVLFIEKQTLNCP